MMKPPTLEFAATGRLALRRKTGMSFAKKLLVRENATNFLVVQLRAR
jgi:hypothetical protein